MFTYEYILLAVFFLNPILSFHPRNGMGRIMNGTNTTIEERPYMVSFQFNSTHVCGGSIISPTWILTAAHCFSKYLLSTDVLLKKNKFSIRAGSTFNDHGGETIYPKSIIIHKNYSCRTNDFDIALVELSKAIKTPVAKPIPLPAEGDPPAEGTLVTVSGWGELFENSSSSPNLQTTTFAIVNREECRCLIKRLQYDITDRMFCAGEWFGQRDSCSGDSGGPLVVNGVVIGVVSFGTRCEEPTLPGVYTSVPNLRGWIKEKSGI